MEKLSLFRRLNERLPAIAEKVIGHWGTVELDAFIDRLVREAPSSGLGLNEEILAILRDLKTVHIEEFPKFAALTAEAVTQRLSGDADFLIIQRRFPHIGAQIIAAWGRRSFYFYVDSLFNEKKRQKRQGFPEDVVLAIFRLSQVHDREFPASIPTNRDVWSSHDEHGMRLL